MTSVSRQFFLVAFGVITWIVVVNLPIWPPMPSENARIVHELLRR